MLNRVLPRDIRVLDWAPVAEGFSARFDCQTRTYRYYFPRGSLDVVSMAAAAKRWVSPISSVGVPTVMENLESHGICNCHFPGVEKSWNFVKSMKVLGTIAN